MTEKETAESRPVAPDGEVERKPCNACFHDFADHCGADDGCEYKITLISPLWFRCICPEYVAPD